jgi:hypothetical protein
MIKTTGRYDELRVESAFLRMIASKFIVKAIKKKAGKDADVKIEKLYLASAENDVDMNVDLHIKGTLPKRFVHELINGYLEEK